MSRRCKSRHRKSWSIGSGGHWMLWCYECGALRYEDEDSWVYPVGPEAENPAVTRYRKAHPA